MIEQVTVRFEDVNGPRGGIDAVCRIKIDVKRRPSIQTSKQDASLAVAFVRALDSIGVAIDRMRQKHHLHARRREPAPEPAFIGELDVDHFAHRTRLAKTTRATAAIEESNARPSRKSTRRSANHGKPSQTKERAAAAAMLAPSARMERRG
ncbi:MAG: hypothetical protein AB7L28_10865 [Kofleriaceae bacterium]